MLDRSGSMYGMPIQEAKKALIIALQMLTTQVNFLLFLALTFVHSSSFFIAVVDEFTCCRIALPFVLLMTKWSGLAPMEVRDRALFDVIPAPL